MAAYFSGSFAALFVTLLFSVSIPCTGAACTSLLDLGTKCPITPGAPVPATLPADCCTALKAANDEGCLCDPGVITAAANFGITIGSVYNISRACGVESSLVKVPGSPLCNANATVAPAAAPPMMGATCNSANFIAPIASSCNESYNDPTAKPSKACCNVLRPANDAMCFCNGGIADLIKTRPNLINNIVSVCNITDFRLHGQPGCPGTGASPAPSPGAAPSQRHGLHLLWATLTLSFALSFAVI